MGNRTGSARTRVPVPEAVPRDRVESARIGDSVGKAVMGNCTGSARTRVPVPEAVPGDRVEGARTGDSMAEAVMGNPGGRDATTDAQNVIDSHCSPSAEAVEHQIPWIDLGELVFIKRIGEGGYGVVDEYEWKGCRVAVKTLAYEGREHLEHEVALLTKVQRHPNVVELIGCAFNEGQNKGMLVMELLSGDLRSLIDKRRREQRRGAAPFPLEVSLDLMRQMAAGLKHLRQLRVLHRDLKSPNILVKPAPSPHEAGYVLKLSDFGRSKCNEQDSRFYSVVAPPSWRAPEVFRDEDMVSSAYTWSSDVYSFAMVCYEILSGDLPFQDTGMSFAELREAICEEGTRPELPANIPEELLELIEECWATNPDERPAIAEVHQRLLAIGV